MADQVRLIPTTEADRKLFERLTDKGYEVQRFDDNGRTKLVIIKPYRRQIRIKFSGSSDSVGERDTK